MRQSLILAVDWKMGANRALCLCRGRTLAISCKEAYMTLKFLIGR